MTLLRPRSAAGGLRPSGRYGRRGNLPTRRPRGATTIKGKEFHAIIWASVAQQRTAIEHGDYELADRAASVTAWLLDQHLHDRDYWVTK